MLCPRVYPTSSVAAATPSPRGKARKIAHIQNLPLWGRWLSEAKSDEVACAYSALTSAFTSANWLSTSDSFTTDDGE